MNERVRARLSEIAGVVDRAADQLALICDALSLAGNSIQEIADGEDPVTRPDPPSPPAEEEPPEKEGPGRGDLDVRVAVKAAPNGYGNRRVYDLDDGGSADGWRLDVVQQTWPGIDATAVRVFLSNPFAGTGCLDFTKAVVTIEGNEYALAPEGQHTLRPGAVLSREFYVGPDRVSLRDGQQYTDREQRPWPSWVGAKARGELRTWQRQPRPLAPWHPWGDTNGKKEGGDYLGPFRDQWCTSPDGYALRRAEWEGVMDRSLCWRMDADGNPLEVSTSYWLGSPQHRMEGYGPYDLSDPWRAETRDLDRWTDFDCQHFYRRISAAMQLARAGDAGAKLWLRMCYADVRNDWILGPDLPKDSNTLYVTLAQKLRETPQGQGAQWAGRAFCHAIFACCAAAELADDAHARDDLPKWAEACLHVADRNGVLYWRAEGSLNDPFRSGRWTMAREIAFGIEAMRRLDRLEQQFGSISIMPNLSPLPRTLADAADRAASWLGASPINKIQESWGPDPSAYTADEQERFKTLPDYHLFTTGEYGKYGDARGLLDVASRRPTDHDQPLDSAPRSMWEGAI